MIITYKVRNKKGGVIEINFGNAHNMVNWDFLLEVLLKKGLWIQVDFMEMWLHFKHLYFLNRKQRGLS